MFHECVIAMFFPDENPYGEGSIEGESTVATQGEEGFTAARQGEEGFTAAR